MKINLLMCTYGAYEDYCNIPVCAYEENNVAECISVKCNNLIKEYNDWHHDAFNPEGDYDDDFNWVESSVPEDIYEQVDKKREEIASTINNLLQIEVISSFHIHNDTSFYVIAVPRKTQ